MSKFKLGDTIIFDPSNFNQEYWKNLSEKDKIKYYSRFGYGSDKSVFFTFICEHSPQSGHCLIINMDTQQIETMVHMSEFRLVTEDEC